MEIENTDQGETQSVEDRLMNALGHSLQEEASAEVEQTETRGSDDEFAELEWDGVKFKVPSKAKEAFMKNEDYTRKTQELAEQRKSVEHVHELAKQRQLDAAFNDSIANEQREIAVIDAYLAQAKTLNWASMSTDEILRAKLELDNVRDRRAQLQETVNSKRSKFMEEVQTRIKEMRGKSRELASKSINGFSEEAEKAMRAYAADAGLSETEIDNVLLDPRSYKIIWEASQFRKVQASTAKVDKAEKLLKPGAASERMPDDVKDKLNFRKAMKSAKTSTEKAAHIENRLAGLFGRGG